jgi:predicted metalloprotease
MRLDDQSESDNVEDRRGGGGGIGRGSIGIGTLVIALVAGYFFGIDPALILGLASNPSPGSQQAAPRPPAGDDMGRFVAKVLGSTESTWQTVFSESGRRYEEPKLVLFTGATPTACGTGQSAMGPFYCPSDQKVYIDLAFFRDLRERFHAPGEFAQAYVIAHEVGHHVQNLLGISDQVRAAQQRSRNPAAANALSVRQELQADCFAGIWGHRADSMQRILEPGETEQALTAASAIGDDRLQRQTQGRIVPESFTHGTSEQRVRWFKRGMESGDIRQCDTFNAASL